MARYEIEKFFSNEGSRNEVRQRVIAEFLREKPGLGNGDLQSKYIYFVEILKTGNKVYLERPANLHNGFDFLINVENTNFSKTNRIKYNPAHEDIFNDLKIKKEESEVKYKKLYLLIEEVFNCREINNDISLVFNTGYPVDLILKVIKWFFIEQDIRYWNYSGRTMFMSGVPKF
jgi:hypothetical protein